jgi:2-polyprenyl-3-methyl-5-hydroxy-6-metoxy-1,4-benzoquinol methylase
MSVTQTEQRGNKYALGHTPEEYERLRAQARMWEAAAGRLFDRVRPARGAFCLDAGCGPGETMRTMAERVGPTGQVLGIDRDASLGALAVEMLHGEGHRQCSFREHDLSEATAVPGGPFDLIYARLLLFHLPQRVETLSRLWDAVAPGGHLIVQDYDFRSIGSLPDLASIGELTRVFTAAFTTVGADVHVGIRLPELFRQAGIGAPDGTDVAGYLDPLPNGSAMVAQVFRSVLPVALAHGITTEDDAAAALAATEQDAARHPDGQLMWPLLIGAWKRKEPA